MQGVFRVSLVTNIMPMEAGTHVLRELRVLLYLSPFFMPAPLFPDSHKQWLAKGGPPGQLGERGHAEAQRVHRVPDQTEDMYVILQWGGVRVLCLLMSPTLMPFVSLFCFCFWGRGTHFFTAGWHAAWVNRNKVGSKHRSEDEMFLTNVTAY